MTKKMNLRGGNWETIACILIKKILVVKNPHFSRSELMTTEHLDFAVTLSSALGHKSKPDIIVLLGCWKTERTGLSRRSSRNRAVGGKPRTPVIDII